MAPAPADIVRDALDAWERHDFDALVSLFDERAEVRSVVARRLQGEDVYRGPEGVRRWLHSISDNLDLRVQRPVFLTHGSFVLALAMAQAGPRSGGPVLATEWATVCEVAGGRITFFETHFDHGDALISLGEKLKSRQRSGTEPAFGPADLDVS